MGLLRSEERVTTRVIPAMSFLDLAWERVGVDPLESGVKLVDGARFRTEAAGSPGPFLVAQLDSRSLLSDVKLALSDGCSEVVGDEGPDDGRGETALILHHLGLADEVVIEVPWTELDRTLEPDHLTSVWIPKLTTAVAGELVALEELVRILRARCPWDMRQTHASLARHLLEETYETMDAIAALSAAEPDPSWERVEHLEEELGDLLIQVYFHAVLGEEEGRFNLATIARRVHDKLVSRHPHVFGDAVAHTPEEVAERWEVLKQMEKGRSSVFDGVPRSLPSLALAAKTLRKAESVGFPTKAFQDRLAEVQAGLRIMEEEAESADRSGETLRDDDRVASAVGSAFFALSDLARRLGVDAETALRASAGDFRRAAEANM